jgi:hypothetical protein
MSGISKGAVIGEGVIKPDELFFEEVMTILISSFTFTCTMELILRYNSPVLHMPEHALRRIEFPFAAITEDKTYCFLIYDILINVGTGKKNEEVPFVIREKTITSVKDIQGAKLIENKDSYYFIKKVIGSSFISFYDRVKPLAEKKYGSDIAKWPSEINFARTVRNAFAHHNLINISNPKAPPVSWNKLTYTYQDHGKDIFEHFYVVEIIDLMKEISKLL